MRESWWLVAQTSGAKIYWVVATLITSVITARYLGPEGRGVFVAAVGWVTMFSTFGHLSLGQIVIHLATTAPGGERWLMDIIGSAFAILGASALIGYAVVLSGYFATGGGMFHHLTPGVLAVAFAALPFMLWIENGNGILMSIDRLPVMNLAQATGATATLLLTFAALGMLHLRVRGALAAQLIAQGLIVTISAGYLIRRAGGLAVTRETVQRLLGGGAQLHLNAIGTYLFTQANVLILNHYRSAGETAYYQLAVQLMTGLQIIPLAVSAVAYSLVAKHGPDAAWPQQRRLLLEVVLLVLLIVGIAYFAAPLGVRLVFGKAFLPSVPLLRILLLGALGMTISIVMASQWIARGLFLQAAFVTLAIGALTVAANYLVVPRYGMFGAAWVTVGTYVLTMVINIGMAAWVDRISTRRAVAS